jgi:hypothetical protein
MLGEPGKVIVWIGGMDVVQQKERIEPFDLVIAEHAI